jgi:hypothetical protein
MRFYTRLLAACLLLILLCACDIDTLLARHTAPSISAAEQAGAVVVGDRVIFTLQSGVGSISPLERAGIVNARLKCVLSDPNCFPNRSKFKGLALLETIRC